MARTASMPKSIQSDIPMDAVGEALLQHYNVGIENPWFKIGRSDQETYNRRRLPWSGNNYSVDSDGNVSGPNRDELPEGLVASWRNMNTAARAVLQGENYENLEALAEQGLEEMKSRLSVSGSHEQVTVTTADGGSKTIRRYVPPDEAGREPAGGA